MEFKHQYSNNKSLITWRDEFAKVLVGDDSRKSYIVATDDKTGTYDSAEVSMLSWEFVSLSTWELV